MDTPFDNYPFKHIYIEDLFTQEHLEMFKESEQIKLQVFNRTEDLIDGLKAKGYSAVKFPGCTTNANEYLKWFYTKELGNFYNNEVIEGFGMAFRLENIKSLDIQRLVEFLNSEHFHTALHKKFNLTKETRVSTGIQKYLTGYEISPHPDIRSKALTYLININTEDDAEKQDVHTHLLKFKKKHQQIYNFWKENKGIDRCWVPWDWCTTEKYISKNNSLIMFAPADDTLHAVKLDYNHLPFQRTQLYGNLWYKQKQKVKSSYYQDLLL